MSETGTLYPGKDVPTMFIEEYTTLCHKYRVALFAEGYNQLELWRSSPQVIHQQAKSIAVEPSL